MLGKYSAGDLNPSDILQVAIHLSDALQIPVAKVLYATLNKVEWGKTFSISIPCTLLISKFYRFSTLESVRRISSLYFEGDKYDLKIYDKAKEVLKKASKDGIHLKIEENAELFHKHLLRIEIDAKGQTGIRQKLRNVKTLADVITQYPMLNITLLKEIKRIQMKSQNENIDIISFEGEKTTAIYPYISKTGIDKIGIEMVHHFIDQTSTANKTHHRNKIRDIENQFEKLDQYNRFAFFAEIKAQIIEEIKRPRIKPGFL